MKFSLQIPAQPGYFVLDLVRDETGYPTVDKVGIVAWAFEAGDELSIPYPVTMGGVRTDSPMACTPSGVFDSSGVWRAPSALSWQTDLQTAHRAKSGGVK